jgi:hypothetical protein
MTVSRKTCTLALLVAAVAACSSEDNTGPKTTTFVATLTQSAETPAPKPTQASGNATFVWNGSSLTGTVIIQNMDSVTAAHIHAPAQPGLPAGVVLPLYTSPIIPHVGNAQTLVSKPFVQTDITSATISLDSLVTLMKTGQAYVNVHTKLNPAGEIRGQISVQQ